MERIATLSNTLQNNKNKIPSMENNKQPDGWNSFGSYMSFWGSWEWMLEC